jgi:hypothetical protein
VQHHPRAPRVDERGRALQAVEPRDLGEVSRARETREQVADSAERSSSTTTQLTSVTSNVAA